MKQKKARCPDCGNNSVRKRGVSTPANIARRRIKERRHRYVCDNCEWTGDTSDWEDVEPENAESAMNW